MKKFLIYIILLITLNQVCLAQQPVSGTVISETGKQPLAGASIRVSGTDRATATDEAGHFKITLGATETLTVSFIGYKARLLSARDLTQQPLMIALEGGADLEEVLISTGYQTIPKERATGSFVTLDDKQLNRRISTDIVSRLEDLVPGLLFNRRNSNSLSVRGQSTIHGNASPLIVLDNFPYEGDINTINPNDVESITVLKDAAAASIWGARAGNGVIVITTRKGAKNGKMKVAFNSNLTVGGIPDMFYQSRMTTADYIDMEKLLFSKNYYRSAELSANKTVLSPVVDLLIAKRDGRVPAAEADGRIEALKAFDIRNDYERYLYRNSANTQSSLSISGGEANRTYYVSAGYDRNLESLDRNSNDRFTLNAANTFSALKNKLEIRSGLYYVNSARAQNNPGLNAINIAVGSAVYPYARLADDNGEPAVINRNYRSTYLQTLAASQPGLLDWNYRPLEDIRLADNTSRKNEYRINTGITFKARPDLQAEVLYQYNRSFLDSRNLQSAGSYYTRDQINLITSIGTDGSLIRPIPEGGILDRGMILSDAHNIRGQINYNKNWNQDHMITAIAGSEVRDVTSNSQSYRLYGYDDDHATAKVVDYASYFTTLYNPARLTIIPNVDKQAEATDRYLSYYSNAAYSYKSRYTISGSARIDQSNLFGVKANQKGVPLWSAGLAYQVSDEAFYKVDALPYLKLRLTYGYNGNVNRNASALTTARYSSIAYLTSLPFATISNPPNPELRWERIKMVNLAADFETKGNRISGTIEYYRKKGIDLIGDSPYAPSTGITSFRANNANIKGQGIDITINSRNIDRAFKWNTSFIYSYTADEVTEYKQQSPSYSYIQAFEGMPLKGKPLYSLYSYRSGGLDPQTGIPLGYLNGEESTDYSAIVFGTKLEDMVFSGSSRPVHFGAIRNTFSWKSFSLSANISYRLGYSFRRNSVNYNSVLTGKGSHGDFSKRWQKPGDELTTTVPAMPAVRNIDRDAVYQYSEGLVEKGHHLRLQDINLSYEIIKEKYPKLPFSQVQVYLYANNLGLIWKANKAGLDPDYANWPQPSTIAGGLKLNF